MSDRYSLLDDWLPSDFRVTDAVAARRAATKTMEPDQDWNAVLPWLERIDPGLPAEDLRARCFDSLAHAWKKAVRHIKETVVATMGEADLLRCLSTDRDAFDRLIDSGAVILDPTSGVPLAA